MNGGSPRHYLADAELAESGARRISYSERSMPLLQALAHRFGVERPFDGMTVAACLHVTAETAVLARVLVAGGARVALGADGASGASGASGPDLIIDDGGDLVNTLHTERADVLPRVFGFNETATT